jgi:hypothetical protein
MDKVLLRFKDLRRYGIKNHPTLARWIREGVPQRASIWGLILGPGIRKTGISG